MLGRYGKHLTGSDVKVGDGQLETKGFDEETREMLGLDDIEEILGQIEEESEPDVEAMEEQAQAIKEGEDPANIQDPDEVIQEMEDDFNPASDKLEQSDGGESK